MHDDNLNILEMGDEPESPLDSIPPVDTPSEIPPPDPEEMLALLSSPEAPQRMLAARAFCELQDKRASPLLIQLLVDDCPLVRVSAAYALGRNPSPDAVTPLIKQLQEDWNGYVRKGVVWALGNCGKPNAVQPLTYALRTDISAVRLWAASSLAQMTDLEPEDTLGAIEPLIEGLQQDSIAAVRSNCAWALGQLCRELTSNDLYRTAIEALLDVLVEDEDVGVQEDARAALLRLGDPQGLQKIEELELEGFF